MHNFVNQLTLNKANLLLAKQVISSCVYTLLQVNDVSLFVGKIDTYVFAEPEMYVL